jgi:hypothetical protein
MNGDEARRLGEKLLAEVEVMDLSSVRTTKTAKTTRMICVCVVFSDLSIGNQSTSCSKYPQWPEVRLFFPDNRVSFVN